MKKTILLFITVLFIAAVLFGCENAAKPADAPVISTAAPTAVQTAVQAGTQTQPTDTQPTDTQPTETQASNPKVCIAENPVDFSSVYGENTDNLYDITGTKDGCSYYVSDVCGNFILFNEYDDSYQINPPSTVVVYDAAAGKIFARSDSDDNFEHKFLDDGRIYTAHSYDGVLNIYDTGLVKQKTYTFEKKAEYMDVFVPTTDGRYMLIGSDGVIDVINLETNEKRTANVGDYMYVISIEGSTVVLGSYKRKSSYVVFDVETLEVNIIDNISSYAPIENISTHFVNSKLYAVHLAEPDKITVLPCYTADETYHTSDYGCVFTTELETEKRICVYDINSGSSASAKFNGNSINNVKIGKYGYAVITYYIGDDTHTAIWDFSSCTQEIKECVHFDAGELTASNTSLADEIYADTGIRIFYGSEGNDYTSGGYVSSVEKNEFLIHEALIKAKAFLALYPDGMFDEMCEGITDGIRMFFAASFHRTENSSISSAAALTFKYDGYRYVIVDINNLVAFESNVSHEFMHVMEDRLEKCQTETGIPYVDNWLDFVPSKGKGYHNSYTDDNGNDISDNKFTVYDDCNEKDIWFIDSYSKTFPTEDRARILENIMNDDEEELAWRIKGENIWMKARYLCVIIRECFECAKNAETLPWEKNVSGITRDEFADILVAEEK